MSYKTIKKRFDNDSYTTGEITTLSRAINIIFDATYFEKKEGLLLFRSEGKNIYWRKIQSESKREIESGFENLDQICSGGYLSFTIDGKRGVRQLLEKKYIGIPVQHCLFHQKKTVLNYTTRKPKTECGKSIKHIVEKLLLEDDRTLRVKILVCEIIFKDFLKEKNEKGEYTHKRLRSALRSLKVNLPYLFTYKKYPLLQIENTTNSCDGYFSHLKSKIQIHRGLRNDRKWKMIHYLLTQDSNSIS